MEDFRNMYFALFNAITDAIENLEKMKQQLIFVQQKAEEMYIAQEES